MRTAKPSTLLCVLRVLLVPCLLGEPAFVHAWDAPHTRLRDINSGAFTQQAVTSQPVISSLHAIEPDPAPFSIRQRIRGILSHQVIGKVSLGHGLLLITGISFLLAAFANGTDYHLFSSLDSSEPSHAIASLKSESVTEATAREAIGDMIRENDQFRKTISAMAIPAELGLKREEVQSSINDLQPMVAKKPINVVHQVPVPAAFSVLNAGRSFEVNSVYLPQLQMSMLIAQAILVSDRTKADDADRDQAISKLVHGLKPFLISPMPKGRRYSPEDALWGGFYKEDVFRDPALAAEARTIVRTLWRRWVQVGYVEMSVLNEMAGRDHLPLKKWLEGKLRAAAERDGGYSFEKYLEILKSPDRKLTGLIWYGPWLLADHFDADHVTKGFEIPMLNQLMQTTQGVKYMVQSLAKTDSRFDAQFKKNFEDWARETLLHSDSEQNGLIPPVPGSRRVKAAA